MGGDLGRGRAIGENVRGPMAKARHFPDVLQTAFPFESNLPISTKKIWRRIEPPARAPAKSLSSVTLAELYLICT